MKTKFLGYRIVCYMRIDLEDDIIYKTKKEAQEEIENHEIMQSENIYIIEKAEEITEEIEED